MHENVCVHTCVYEWRGGKVIHNVDACIIVEPGCLITVPLTLLQVFGFLIQLVWAVNIGWLVIDTSWYINRTSRRQGYAPL